ncbi:hypothetical protein [Mycobacterium sp. URHB0044]|uniref:hypothetical protein n=1 Tax=Mycobacterium sp. URHB0044 TaxID=1380386 RepID=UPI000A87C25F|nr:hypothetical protein [Mycobacterium sp. URHB0044]
MTTSMKLTGKTLLAGGFALAALGLASGTAQAFNPQPEPPTKPSSVIGNPVQERSIIAVHPQQERPPQISIQGGP